MSDPNFIILYVDNPPASAAFYAGLLGDEPVETSPTFAMFVLSSVLRFGLWSRHTVEPAATTTGGGGEIAFTEETRDAVDTTHRAWRDKGLKVVQEPTVLDFGYTFVALDPDGHRLRVFCPGGGEAA